MRIISVRSFSDQLIAIKDLRFLGLLKKISSKFLVIVLGPMHFRGLWSKYAQTQIGSQF